MVAMSMLPENGTEKPQVNTPHDPAMDTDDTAVSPGANTRSEKTEKAHGDETTSTDGVAPVKVEGEGEDESQYPTGLKLSLIVLALCISIFLVALDQTIIAPALGAITAEFRSVKDIGWCRSPFSGIFSGP